jgi:hypothetical protein
LNHFKVWTKPGMFFGGVKNKFEFSAHEPCIGKFDQVGVVAGAVAEVPPRNFAISTHYL